jgi:chromosome segregation ATPase
MANKNKNKESLIAASYEDANSRSEISALLRPMSDAARPEIEVDAQTFDIDEKNSEANGLSNAELKAALQEQTSLNEELNFEVEQLHGLQRGLQEELKAREEIANHIYDDRKEARASLKNTICDLELRTEECQKLQVVLDNADKRSQRVNDETSSLQIAAKEFKREIRSLKSDREKNKKKIAVLENELKTRQDSTTKQGRKFSAGGQRRSPVEYELQNFRTEIAELRTYVDGRKRDWAQMDADLAMTSEMLKSSQTETAQLQSNVEERNSELADSHEQLTEMSVLLTQQKDKVRELNAIVRRLENELDQDIWREINDCRIRIATQSGDIAEKSHEIDVLLKDNLRIESYADDLRMQLQDQVSISKVSEAMRLKLDSGLDYANESNSILSRKLDTERHRNSELTIANESIKQEYEDKIRRISTDLGTAEDTIAGQETSNEQLVSDLIDTRSIRTTLESQLGAFEKETDRTIQQLKQELKKAKQRADDYERKLRLKDRAVTDLMQELANRNCKKTKSDAKVKIKEKIKNDSDNALKKIDGFRGGKDSKRSKNDRDRVARLLVGNADGRELRFPLFKDRLTIGRTSHNDIQLNMQFISRRHAVISSDRGNTRVIDWGSKNGVYVNEKKVTEQILKPGDVLTIGTTDFKYEEREKQ